MGTPTYVSQREYANSSHGGTDILCLLQQIWVVWLKGFPALVLLLEAEAAEEGPPLSQNQA
jgi:hypothetical protein